MPDDNLFDFLLFNELLFPEEEDKTYECPHCGRVIEGDEKVECIGPPVRPEDGPASRLDKKKRIFKCPACGYTKC